MPGSYVDLDKVLHVGPSTGVLGEKDKEAELLEGAQEDPQAPGQLHPKDL